VPTERRPFLLRLDPKVLSALQRWAQDDLRSVNAQIEFLLRGLLVRAGRLRDPGGTTPQAGGSSPPSGGAAGAA